MTHEIKKALVVLELALILSVKEPMELSDRVMLNIMIREAMCILKEKED